MARRRVSCPLCKNIITNLNRHLAHVHGFDSKKIKRIKKKHSRKGIYKTHFGSKQCKYESCGGKFFIRLDRHYIRKHGHVSKDKTHLRLLREAKKFDPLVKRVKHNYDKGENVFSYLESFYEWMMSPDGESKQHDVARQHERRVRSVLSYLCKQLHKCHVDGDGPFEIDIKSDNIRGWFTNVINFAPTTRRSYLFSLLHFAKFMNEQIYRKVFEVLEKREVDFLIQRCYTWSKSLKMSVASWKNKKILEESESIIDDKQVTAYRSSDYVQRAIKLLSSVGTVSKDDYEVMRNYLILELQLHNAQRSGVYEKLTVSEFEKTAQFDHSGIRSYVLSVLEHKTSAYHGPANLYMTERLYLEMKSFYNIRTTIPGCDNFFIYYRGTPLFGSGVVKAIQNAWKAANMTTHITSTKLRKAVVTMFHGIHSPGLRNRLAQHMNHLTATAESHYKYYEKREQSVDIGEKIASLFVIKENAAVSTK